MGNSKISVLVVLASCKRFHWKRMVLWGRSGLCLHLVFCSFTYVVVRLVTNKTLTNNHTPGSVDHALSIVIWEPIQKSTRATSEDAPKDPRGSLVTRMFRRKKLASLLELADRCISLSIVF